MANIQKIIESFNDTIPELERQRQDLYALRDKITKYFSREKLSSMSLDEYCLGKKNDETNFSYALEYKLEGLGSISGRNGASSLFGVWYSKADGQYKISRTYKKNYDTHLKAFNQIKKDIVELYDLGKSEDIGGIFNSQLDDWFKGKFLATYFPERYLNIYTKNRLIQYVEFLGINAEYYESVYLREYLINWKNSNPITKKWSVDILGEFLWQLNDIIDEGVTFDEDRIADNIYEVNELDIKNQFLQYMLQCVKSQNKKESFDTLGQTSADSYVRHAELDKLYDFDITKKPDAESIYEITSSVRIKKIIDSLLDDNAFTSKDGKAPSQYFRSNAIKQYYWFLKSREFFMYNKGTIKEDKEPSAIDYNKYLIALRTKPFMLLAGISGTGKSRIVRELAYKSCPEGELRADKTTPGNYLMVEVKPNWHDSSELLGYYSNISKKYILTPFVKFLVKAKKYPNVPFFVCLDEMNLAPVEQYFAEFLSVLETRRKVGNTIKSGTLVKKENLTELGETEDLTLPANVFIVGTVNMDDTTHQFSRKVIDRAMTIEMNGGNLEDMFGHSNNLEYTDKVWTMDNELQVKYVSADEVTAAHERWAREIKKILPEKLNAINKCLKGTPFEVSYRVLNELVIYLGVLLDDSKDVDEDKFNVLVNHALDQILLMKVLPRIEGDAEMFNLGKEEIKENELNNEINNKLTWLKSICPDVNAANNEMTSKKKLEEMLGRFDSGFTRYWP